MPGETDRHADELVAVEEPRDGSGGGDADARRGEADAGVDPEDGAGILAPHQSHHPDRRAGSRRGADSYGVVLGCFSVLVL